MLIEIPEEELDGLQIDRGQARVDFAVGLYTSGSVSLGRAAKLARMRKADFRAELTRRGIPMQYDVDDLQSDLQTLTSLRGK